MKYSLKTIARIEELIDNEEGDKDKQGCDVLCKEHFLFPMLRRLKTQTSSKHSNKSVGCGKNIIHDDEGSFKCGVEYKKEIKLCPECLKGKVEE